MNEETKIQREIQDYLNKNKILNWRESDSKNSGRPDLLVCYKGRTIGLEVKTPTGKATKLQIANIQDILDAGGYGIFPTSVEDVIKVLRQIDRDTAWQR